ncbi:unnamed protein product [Haemonchus placei]|uniref:MARVEL domain-containing protein n=1 Tax=Haemonchus placei TaxID=6290 RepID=A0A0N4VWN8_HAEPC|nr:unnamed protein product [Haemonchus placei]
MSVIAINECPSERSAPSNGEAQEIVQPNDENLKRAAAGGIGGLSGNELFLVVLAICVTAFCVVNLIFNYQHMSLITTIAALTVAILAIVAVITKSSILMLIVLIVLSLVVGTLTIILIINVIGIIVNGFDSSTAFIVSLVIAILIYIGAILACISACVLHKQY